MNTPTRDAILAEVRAWLYTVFQLIGILLIVGGVLGIAHVLLTK